ncbi:COP9 signalosome complex subunit 7a [Vanrija pseudolonga]|uniref:COP9 signalosome complex subunit 7a n=1 Tax=Vanrija pseudolonga TaxID=143232 RepID=A0AAF0YDX3_9TREE|nr:COP9 signalosome complex subunit 7a [Vanrija pseudolonga]
MSERNASLEPFLLLARSTKGAAAAKVVLDATAANGVYVFSELLEQPNIKALQNDPSYDKHYRLLDLFAYRTLSDYRQSPDSYPPLTAAHQTKLKQLTLLSLALQHRSLPYAQLTEVLQVGSTRELENVIIDSIYAGLLRGKMHHHEEVLHVDWVSSRDLARDDLVKIQSSLNNWSTNAQTILGALDEQIARIRSQNLVEAEHNATYQKQLDQSFKHARDEQAARRSEKSKSGGPKYSADWDDEDFDGHLASGERILPGRGDHLPDPRAKKRVRD